MKLYNIYIILIAIVSLIISSACANRGAGPQGGPKDVTPPRLVKSRPVEGELNYSRSKMELYFDEIVQVQSAMEKVVISPPQKTPPKVASVGKKLIVEFKDTLEDDASYTVDFSDAIVDNNEKNPLNNFSLSFSTGETLDSMQVSGTLLEASTLNTMKGIIVGLHSDLSDTAFTKHVFRRVSKTDDRGQFTIKNVKPGTYKIYALKDIGNNFRFDYPNEIIAYSDSLIVPSLENTYIQDTVWIGEGDTAQVDTIIENLRVDYFPNDLLLFGFVEDPKKQFLKKHSRASRYNFSLEFAKPLDSLPKITGLNFNLDSTVVTVPSESMDTVHYWIVDSALVMQDTLMAAVEYPKTDSIGEDVLVTDTLRFLYRVPKGEKNRPVKAENDSVKKIVFSSFSIEVGATHDFYVMPKIKFTMPCVDWDLSKCYIEEKVDTLWKKIGGEFLPNDSIVLEYIYSGDLLAQKDYRVVVDSAAFTTVDGNHTNKQEQTFRTRSLEDYGKIKVAVKNARGDEVIQLLDKSDRVVRVLSLSETSASFEYLMPGDYYMRLFIDNNSDGKWTNGNYILKRQPESVYYFPYPITVRAFWDVEEDWNYMEFPIEEQKPRELIKDSSK